MKKILLFVVIIILFIIRFYRYEKTHVSHIPSEWFGATMAITGVVTDDPDRGLDATKITLGKIGILVALPSAVSVAYGDRVEVYGKIEQPESFITDTDRQFDYPKYLAVHDIYATMKGNDIRILDHSHGNALLKKLFVIKKYFVGTIKKMFPKAEAGLFAGIIIGEKSLLPKDTLSDFQIAGLTHMIVLSGYNITIIAVSMIALLAWCGLGYRGRRIGAIAIIPVFLLVTGMGASSVRAGIMSIITFGLQVTTRPPHTFRIIVYAAGAMIFANPRILFHDPSFHMSFLAFIGLIYVTPLLEKFFSNIPEWYGLRDLVAQTLSVQLFVMPYILWMSGTFSWLLLFSNILTVPMVPLVMGIGFLVTITGMLSYGLGSLLAIPVRFGLTYIIWIAHRIAGFSSFIVTIPPFGAGWMVVIYIIWVAILLVFRFRKID